ncbi:MAG: valine--tRNA ligase [Tissierellia bacterium]|nr:valine--tRNA ligase [Tissierellia bacterium]
MKELDTRYSPQDFEERIYEVWMEHKAFKPEVHPEGKPYCVMMPPPNVTGNLHMGHALYTLQDIYVRLKRMEGYASLWLPGTDHASISTESRVVNKIRSQGKTKEELGREGFLEEAWAWTHEHGGNIIHQLKKLGASCDWDRLNFTLDEHFSHAVFEAFKHLYEEGLIYKGDRIINWCPDCGTAISDAEVEHEESESKIWEIKYPLEDGSGYLTIATTRPETMLGDLAVAVHPEDERYRNLVGKSILLPLTDRKIPIIADSYVDMEFGTGAVKITPSHDPNDFVVGERHSLGHLQVIDGEAKMNDNAYAYAGMDRYEARKAILRDLDAQGLLASEKSHENAVGHCERCGTVIEPLLSKQWFVKMEHLAKISLDQLDQGKPNFYPERFEKIYRHWLEDLKDWCISRQLWWGHRIPVYYCDDCQHVHVSSTDVSLCEACGSSHITQDSDTLDTWFSSALWPFGTLGWPNMDSEDLKKFFPTDLLVTGYDIIFFWVIRMVFSSLWHMDEVPFKDVFLTGLVRDKQGRKMSKSLGNGIDPLEIIREYGADALRFSLVIGNAPGNDLRFDDKKVENGRNFANKVWNAARFTLMNLPEDTTTDFSLDELEPQDLWILEKLNDTIATMNRNFSKYEVGLAADRIYSFIWEDYCDYYIEFCKNALYGEDERRKAHTRQVLLYVLRESLKLLHPFMPFITEEIYQALPSAEGLIITSSWPEVMSIDDSERDFRTVEKMKEVIRSIRNARSTRNIEAGKKSKVILAGNEELSKKMMEHGDLIRALVQVTEIEFSDTSLNAANFLKVSIPELDMYLPLKELIDFEKEKIQIQKNIQNYMQEIERLRQKLSNPGFTEKAPEAVVNKERDKLADYESLLSSAEQSLKELGE